ncbi:hypothetical protein ACQ4PT_000026 [Festuca glaucescens]
MMVCDVLSDDPHDHSVPLWFIPLPGLMPGNKEDHICPWCIRDETCTNGSLKFVEIEHFRIPDAVEESAEPCDPDVIYDDLCFVWPLSEDDSDKMQWPHSLFGWRAVIWNRVLLDKTVGARGVRFMSMT